MENLENSQENGKSAQTSDRRLGRFGFVLWRSLSRRNVAGGPSFLLLSRLTFGMEKTGDISKVTPTLPVANILCFAPFPLVDNKTRPFPALNIEAMENRTRNFPFSKPDLENRH